MLSCVKETLSRGLSRRGQSRGERDLYFRDARNFVETGCEIL